MVETKANCVSPNHNEALDMLSISTPRSASESEMKAVITKACRRVHNFRPKVAAIIRAGHMGCCYALTSPTSPPPDPSLAPEDPREEVDVLWIPPYWEPGVPGYEKAVVDPTGAGNAFMGGLSAALDRGRDVEEGKYTFKLTWD